MVLGGDVSQKGTLHNALGKGLFGGGSPMSRVVATDADEVRKMWCA